MTRAPLGQLARGRSLPPRIESALRVAPAPTGARDATNQVVELRRDRPDRLGSGCLANSPNRHWHGACLSPRGRDFAKEGVAYIVAVGVLVAGSYVSARLRVDRELVTKLRPPAATADAVGTETIPPLQGR